MANSEVFALCDRVRETGYGLYQFLRHGHLERVYEKGMVHRLQKQGIQVQSQFPLTVFDDDGTILGDYSVDLFVEGMLLVELKACRAIDESHTAQLLGYLRASRIEHGLLINFGAPKFQIKKYVLSDIP